MTITTVTRQDIEELRREALEHDDYGLVRLCTRALDDQNINQDDSWEVVERAIRDWRSERETYWRRS